MHKGSCACGAITFEVSGQLPPPDACHCEQCRKFSGHYFVSTDVAKSSLRYFDGEGKLTWHESPRKPLRRGFCSTCGSSLFWDPTERDWIGIAMGAFDGPTKTSTHVHVFVGEKSDYYEIDDGLPKWETVPKRPR